MYYSVDLNFLYKWQEEPWGYMYIISRIAKMLWKAEVSCIDKLNIKTTVNKSKKEFEFILRRKSLEGNFKAGLSMEQFFYYFRIIMKILGVYSSFPYKKNL